VLAAFAAAHAALQFFSMNSARCARVSGIAVSRQARQNGSSRSFNTQASFKLGIEFHNCAFRKFSIVCDP